MEEKDIDAVLDLLSRYLKRFELAQELNREEIVHWFYNRQKAEDQVVWSFVVEQDGKITDFASFYCLESSVIGEMSKKHEKIRAAYLYYYATEHAFHPKENGLKERLLQLMQDLLIEGKKVNNAKPSPPVVTNVTKLTGTLGQIRCVQCFDSSRQPPVPRPAEIRSR